MDQRDLIVGRRRGLDEVGGRNGALGEQGVPHEAILSGRKRVRPDVDLVPRVPNDRHAAGYLNLRAWNTSSWEIND